MCLYSYNDNNSDDNEEIEIREHNDDRSNSNKIMCVCVCVCCESCSGVDSYCNDINELSKTLSCRVRNFVRSFHTERWKHSLAANACSLSH